ncbi:hypothetical protein [Glaciibacter superstes]|uniref:hypothetical protein n=1 Tax=Glaciibacter superstes TaxID=501023 RepID=UPI0003B438EF|nr:hypothetical protein [Glaciibacter superstes]
MIIPEVNILYPYLPGGATAALTNFTLLADTIAEQTTLGASSLLPPALGAIVLLGYAALASAVAVVLPLRRDLA